MKNKKSQKNIDYKTFLIEIIFAGFIGFLSINLAESEILSEFTKWERRGISLLFIILIITLFHFILKLLVNRKDKDL